MGIPGQSDTFNPSQVLYSGSSLGSQRGKGNHGGGPESELLTGTKSFYSYDEVMEMTGWFAHQNVIGEGGFGSVYKGQLPDGRMVAVKQLKAGSGQGDREFRAEVEIISRVHHRHLVSLVGFCIHDNQRLLIYEFLSNKTLDYHLHGLQFAPLEKRFFTVSVIFVADIYLCRQVKTCLFWNGQRESRLPLAPQRVLHICMKTVSPQTLKLAVCV